MNRIVKATAALTAGLLLVTACGDDGTSTKAGGDGLPVTLQIGTEDTAGGPSARQADEFARIAEELSDGRIIVEPVYDANEPAAADWDQVVARKVVSGELDMGMIPTRAWDTEGVDSLRALQAPMLIDSEALLAEVVTSDLADEMLAGLDDIGITGLALVPEGLRRIFGFSGAVAAPGDLDGKAVRAPTSATTSAVVEALGGVADDFDGDDDRFAAAAESGEAVGAESSFLFADRLPAKSTSDGIALPTAVGNQVLFTKVNSIVVNADVFDQLSDADQDLLREAAATTVEWAISNVPSESAAAAAYCKSGGIVATASDEQLDAARSAVQPVFEWLEEDAGTAAAIEEIRDMKAAVPPSEQIEACGGPITFEPGVAGNDADLAAFPDGVYRVEITDDDLRAFEPDISAEDIRNNRGIWTWTLHDGMWEFEQRSTDLHDAGQGEFLVEGDKVSFHLAWVHEAYWATFTWRAEGDTLELLEAIGPIPPAIDATFRAHPWQRIADAGS